MSTQIPENEGKRPGEGSGKRFSIGAFSEFVEDNLELAVRLYGGTKASRVSSIVTYWAVRRHDDLMKAVEFLAAKRHITREEMMERLLSGDEDVTADERRELPDVGG